MTKPSSGTGDTGVPVGPTDPGVALGPHPDQTADGRSGRASILRLITLIVGSIALAWFFHGFATLIVVLALVVMVMAHEFGHFVTAKLSGMKVTEYFLGFGPRIWSMRRGETEYGIKLIPAGGYVRIIGMSSAEEVSPEDESRSYRQASFPRRILVAVAGSSMHILMAFALLWGMYSFVGAPTASVAKIASVSSFVGEVSPAERAGIRAGDEFISINGHHFTDPESYITYIESRPGQMLDVVVLRNGHDVSLSIRPQDRRTIKIATPTGPKALAPASAKPSGAIGVVIDFVTVNQTTNPLNALVRSGSMLSTMTSQTFSGIAQVFSVHGLSSFAHSVATANQHPTSTAGSSGGSSGGGSGQLLSIYGAVALGAQAAQTNVALLIYLLVAINLFVGFINLFPMLPLDGGHVAVAVYERIRSRRGRPYHADVTKLTPVIALFVAFILIVGIAALYSNIVQPVSLTGH